MAMTIEQARNLVAKDRERKAKARARRRERLLEAKATIAKAEAKK